MAEERMNLAALQQRDPYISEIVDTASQVAVYLFNTKTNAWICSIDEDMQLRFSQHTDSRSVYTWPTKINKWQSQDDIIRKLSAPVLLPGCSLILKFYMEELEQATDFLEN